MTNSYECQAALLAYKENRSEETWAAWPEVRAHWKMQYLLIHAQIKNQTTMSNANTPIHKMSILNVYHTYVNSTNQRRLRLHALHSPSFAEQDPLL